MATLQVRPRAAAEHGHIIRAVLVRSVGFAFLWWVLAEGRPGALGLGLIAVVFALAVSLRLMPPRPGRLSVAGLIGFIGYFVWHSLKGGVQVAAIAMRPRHDLAPALLEFPLSLPEGTPRVLMTAAIGLMPGTVGVCLEGERLRLHVLDERLPAIAEAQALQARIARLFRVGA